MKNVMLNVETKFTECEKLSEKREQVNDLMEFLTFLNQNGVQFGEHRNCVNNTPWLNPINLERGGEILAAKFLGINMSEVERERKLIELSTRN